MNTHDLAYAAGLFDGEGNVCISRTRPSGMYRTVRHRLIVQVGMNHEPTISWLIETFGFNKIIVRRHPGQRRRDTYYANLQCLRAAEFLKLVRPYLRTKAEQADLGIHFQETCSAWFKSQPPRPAYVRLSEEEVERRETLASQMNILNQRGQPITPSSLAADYHASEEV